MRTSAPTSCSVPNSATLPSLSGVKPQHAYCDLGYRGHDYKGECDVQAVNRFSAPAKSKRTQC